MNRFTLILLVIVAACGNETAGGGAADGGTADSRAMVDAKVPVEPSPDAGQAAAPAKVASIETVEGRPTLWVDDPATGKRRQLSFSVVSDDIPEQNPQLPLPSDTTVISVHSLTWSPDGTQVAAVVSLAQDQSEIVVLDADGSKGKVASYNGQYIMPDLDWSADGKRLVYLMSTDAHARGLELFMTDLEANRFKRVTTTKGGLRGLYFRQRFDAKGGVVHFAMASGEDGPPFWDPILDIYRANVETGEVTPAREHIIGRVEAISRDGAHALVLRSVAAEDGAAFANQLLDVALSEAGERPVMPKGPYTTAALDARDLHAVLQVDHGTPESPAYNSAVVELGSGVLSDVPTPRGASTVAVWVENTP